MTVVGTRPEIIRLSRVLVSLDNYCEHILVHTGQNYDYELNEVFFEDLQIRSPDFYLNCADHENGAMATMANVISRLDPLLEKVKPEALLVLGDTNSCLAVIPAKRRKIPIFHMEAGNRCFDMRVPEEINRRIVDHTADINLPYSDIAREYLIGEGLPSAQIIKTGSPMREVVDFYFPKVQSSKILEKLNVKVKDYYVWSSHREENLDIAANFQKLIGMLNHLAENRGSEVLVSAHPRTRKKIDKHNLTLNSNVRLLQPLCFTDYLSLQMNAKAVLSDSGTINEEAAILGFAALNIRETHERPEAMEKGGAVLVGLNVDRMIQALDIVEEQASNNKKYFGLVPDYEEPLVSENIVRIILSYTNYVKRVVWSE